MAILARDPSAKLPKLQPNRARILESILYLLEEAGRRDTYLTQYEIVKSLFVADTNHISAHGRPVTFDNYVAMENGPVASEAYDMLKPQYDWHRHVGTERAPWTARPSPTDGKKAMRFDPLRPANLRKLSETDKRALAEGLALIKTLKFKGTKDFTHKHPAYLAAWKDGGKKFDMDYRIIVRDAPELMDEILDVSRHS